MNTSGLVCKYFGYHCRLTKAARVFAEFLPRGLNARLRLGCLAECQAGIAAEDVGQADLDSEGKPSASPIKNAVAIAGVPVHSPSVLLAFPASQFPRTLIMWSRSFGFAYLSAGLDSTESRVVLMATFDWIFARAVSDTRTVGEVNMNLVGGRGDLHRRIGGSKQPEGLLS